MAAPAPTLEDEPFTFPTHADHERMFRWDVLRTVIEENVKLAAPVPFKT